MWANPASLDKPVEVTASNRPIRIAYLVPAHNALSTNLCLDAVFYESYTRWAGVYTIIVPTDGRQLQSSDYGSWLSKFDPDFVYSYVELDQLLVRELDRMCCPIAMLQHPQVQLNEGGRDWRQFLPNWQHYFRGLPSISTVRSPETSSHPRFRDRPTDPTIVTQYVNGNFGRFLSDNFGIALDVYNSTNPIPGLFRTLCLVSPDLPSTHFAGTERCHSMADALAAIASGSAIPIARLAMAHSEGTPRPEAREWISSFRIFIGSTALDRINFWNCRHLGANWLRVENALIINEDDLDEVIFVEQLGRYLNNTNYLGSGQGPCRVALHSASLGEDALKLLAAKIQAHTHNTIAVDPSYCAPATPTSRDVHERTSYRSSDEVTQVLHKDSSEIRASPPVHLTYLPPQFAGVADGQWAIDLNMQRHNNLSKYSNVIDHWTLPRRLKVARAFTRNLARPTAEGLLAVLPEPRSNSIRRSALGVPNIFSLQLPSDETFFRHLALDHFRHSPNDLRSGNSGGGYVELSISDKGQNLRGVIAMFESLSIAFDILTKPFWRSVFLAAKEDTSNPRTFDKAKLKSLLPGSRDELKRIANEGSFATSEQAKTHRTASLDDTLEHLVRSNVFFQVAQWRCGYCGHLNSRSFDNMRIRNECAICARLYMTPIDVEWKYELNDFVYRCLHKQHGLPVLWTLGHLHSMPLGGSFWYLPEVDLYGQDKDDHNEIDILCVVASKFYAVEVKSSVSLFLNKPNEINKFCALVNRLEPDVALLSFQRFCNQETKADEAEIRARLVTATSEMRRRIGRIELKVVVAQELPDFDKGDADLGWIGPRVMRLMQMN